MRIESRGRMERFRFGLQQPKPYLKVYTLIRQLGLLVIGSILYSHTAFAQIQIGTGDRTLNFVLEFWNVPSPEPTPATALTLADLGSAGSAYWFQIYYDLTDLSAVTGLDFAAPNPSVQQVINLWDSIAAGSGISYGGPYSGWGYTLDAISYGSDSNSGFGDYYWSIYSGGSGSSAVWAYPDFGISGLAADDNLWIGFRYTPSSYSFTGLGFVETSPALVPEPGSLGLLLLGAGFLWVSRKLREV